MDPTLARLLAAPIAHRGLHACGGVGPVENSIEAARAAIGRDYAIECDIQLSQDNVPMVFHDAHLDRLTDASGPLARCTASDLAALALRGGDDCIPTLAAFLRAIAGRVPLVIEIKGIADARRDATLVDRTLDLIASYAGPVVLESFDSRIVEWCHAAPCPVGLVGPDDGGSRAVLPARCDFLSWSIDDLPVVVVEHPALPLTTWTVRSPAQQALARRHGAQIVFEGFMPQGFVNPVAT
jgi:glycerophosphoryl diester phosphodiesterase